MLPVAMPVAKESRTEPRRRVGFSSRALVTVFGVATAVAYCMLMPLWEGYDEPAHYGIVQWVGIERTLPEQSRTPVNEELWQSRLLSPASPVFNSDVPPIKTFAQFRSLPVVERFASRRALERIPPALQYRAHAGPPNYEAQQPPLTYALLAIPDRLLSSAPLTTRALALRLLIAVFTVICVVSGMMRLGEELGLPPAFLIAAISLVLMTQTFLGAVCRISNDWMGIALAPWLAAKAIAFLRSGAARDAFWLSACLAMGLLAKANYLAFAPLAFGALAFALVRRKLHLRAVAAFFVPLICVAPCYVRNLMIYGSLTGWHPELSRQYASSAMAVLRQIPWLTYLPRFGRSALWNGNNHYIAFSKMTIDIFLLMAIAAVLLTARALWRAPDRLSPLVAAAASALYTAALVYSIGELYVVHGMFYAIAPWYCPPLFPVLAPLLYWGLSRSGQLGRWMAATLLAMATYILSATWLLKLIPLYAGFPDGSVKVGRLVSWLASSWREAHANLTTLSLGPVWIVYCLVSVSVVSAITLFYRSSRAILRSAPDRSRSLAEAGEL